MVKQSHKETTDLCHCHGKHCLILRLTALLDIFIRFMYVFCYCYSLVFTEDTFFVRVLTNLMKFIINHLQLKNLIAPWTVCLIQMTPIKQMFPVNRTYLLFVKLSTFCIDKTSLFSSLECCFISFAFHAFT